MSEEMNGRTVYTIVRTGCIADRGYFPDPSCEGAFLKRGKAIQVLNELISEERSSFGKDGYDHEERGETFWEMNEEGYAAAHFTRLEILESELNIDEG